MDTIVRPEAYTAYNTPQTWLPDLELTQVGRGTPGGEYLRRFWHPVAHESDLAEVPLRVRILGEDLVVFKDRSGQIGVLLLNCSHRGTSLEYGQLEDRGLRCCYHGRVFDVDGTVLEMPGDPAAERLMKHMRQGAYPVHRFAGLVFVYMGPPEKMPPFPMYDRYQLEGIELVPGPILDWPCNWVQIKENALDPAHTAVLHALQGQGIFSDEFGKFPELAFTETPVGAAYLAIRLIDDNLWIRSTDVLVPNIHSISSFFEDGKVRKTVAPPMLTIWNVPIDDQSTRGFLLHHIPQGGKSPEEMRAAVTFGQDATRPYSARQRLPGDYDAMTSQGLVNPHAREQLGSLDAGVALFRKQLRRGIQAVAEGEDPPGLYRHNEVMETYGTDLVMPAREMPGDPSDATARLKFVQQVAERYLAEPPLAPLRAR